MAGVVALHIDYSRKIERVVVYGLIFEDGTAAASATEARWSL